MLIKLHTIMASPRGTAQPGQIIQVDDATGKALVEGKFATEILSPADAPARQAIETAAVAPPETSSRRPASRTPARRNPAAGESAGG